VTGNQRTQCDGKKNLGFGPEQRDSLRK
jgi:hypothetical protein